MKLAAALLALVLGSPLHAQQAAPAAPLPGSATDQILRGQILRGQYLATAADCIACHTVDEKKPFAGGYPIATPFGTIYGPNITQDKETGIGNWSDEQFVRALHEGIGKHGEHLYPAFPYTAFSKMTRDDVLATWAIIFPR